MRATSLPKFFSISSSVAGPPLSSTASCNSAAMACASEPPSLITSPATVSRCPTYGMSPPLRTWLWCFSSAYTSAFENWPVSFGVEVCSLTVGFPLSHSDHSERGVTATFARLRATKSARTTKSPKTGQPTHRPVAHCGYGATAASVHHDALMLNCSVRTTIDLPDDLHKQALAIARDTRRTLSETVADLMRRGLSAGGTTELSRDPRTGLPLVSIGTVVTSEDVRALEDEE